MIVLSVERLISHSMHHHSRMVLVEHVVQPVLLLQLTAQKVDYVVSERNIIIVNKVVVVLGRCICTNMTNSFTFGTN